jgi:hypothetical protein
MEDLVVVWHNSEGPAGRVRSPRWGDHLCMTTASNLQGIPTRITDVVYEVFGRLQYYRNQGPFTTPCGEAPWAETSDVLLFRVSPLASPRLQRAVDVSHANGPAVLLRCPVCRE